MSDDEQLAEAAAAGVDVQGVGVPIDSPEADPEHDAKDKNVRRDVDGRPLYAWEVEPGEHNERATARKARKKKDD